MEAALKEGKYLYCIIESNQSRSFGHLGIGGRAEALCTVCFDNISAVVSNSPIKRYSASRENMLAHEKAIEEVMKEYTVLPVRFCTIAEDEEQVKRILEKEQGRFAELLEKMNGKKELSLKAIFKEEVVYGEILEKYQDIKELKRKIAALPFEKTYFQRMEVGRMVEAALQREKDIHREEILTALSPLAQDVKVNSPYGERMIISAAWLVEEHRETEFDRKVQELAGKFGDKMEFRYVGTLPPFNFVSLEIDTRRY